MSSPTDRRGFLRGLVSLPLIGGSVALVGRPTAAAVPVSDALLERYHAWLSYEHKEAHLEVERRRAERHLIEMYGGLDRHRAFLAEREVYTRQHPAMYWFPDAPDIVSSVMSAPASTRAAVVLSAAGAGWRERSL